jgi:class 3 adenylate cyclase
MLAAGLVSDLESPAARRVVRAREAARKLGVDEPTGAELIQAYARAVARIVAAEAEIAARTVPAEPCDTYRQRLSDLATAGARLSAEMFAGLHAQQLSAAIAQVADRDAFSTLHTVAFIDLCNSTRFMLECRAAELRAVVDELFFAAQSVAAEYGVSVVKYLGDGVVLLGREPAGALAATLTLIPELEMRTQLEASAGVAHDRVIAHAGDYLGPAMNLASRLAELAKPKEVLIDAQLWPDEPPPGSLRHVRPRGLGSERIVYALSAASHADPSGARVCPSPTRRCTE